MRTPQLFTCPGPAAIDRRRRNDFHENSSIGKRLRRRGAAYVPNGPCGICITRVYASGGNSRRKEQKKNRAAQSSSVPRRESRGPGRESFVFSRAYDHTHIISVYNNVILNTCSNRDNGEIIIVETARASPSQRQRQQRQCRDPFTGRSVRLKLVRYQRIRYTFAYILYYYYYHYITYNSV